MMVPGTTTVQVETGGSIDVTIIGGAPGPAGRDGASADLGDFVAAVSMPIGSPVFVSRADGKLYLADAATYVSSQVVGVTQEAVAAGFVVPVARAAMTLLDWTVLAGTTSLFTGQFYYLAVGGGISSTIPTRPGAAAIAIVGIALSPQTLDVRPLLPISL